MGWKITEEISSETEHRERITTKSEKQRGKIKWKKKCNLQDYNKRYKIHVIQVAEGEKNRAGIPSTQIMTEDF